MSKKIITPLDAGYRPGMMTWSILQKYGIVASREDASKAVSDATAGVRQQLGDKQQAAAGAQNEQQLLQDKDKDAPSKQQKEAFRLALEVALGSSVISEEQVSFLWEASHPLRAKDVAKIASQVLLKQESQASVDAPGVADRFGQVLTMLLAGTSVTSAQIRMMVACTHELTSETIHRVMEEKLRDAYQKKEAKKQLKAEEEKRFRDKFREVLQCLDGSTGLSEEAFQVLLAASVTLKVGVAEEIMASVGTSWDDLNRRRTVPSAVSVTAPASSIAKFSTGPERDRAEAMLVHAAKATAEGRHSAAVDHYKAALEILIEQLRQETSVLGKSELSNYIDYYMNMAEQAKARAASDICANVRTRENPNLSDEMGIEDLEDEFYDCHEPPAPTPPPPKPPKPRSPTSSSISSSTTPPQPPPPPPPPRTSTSATSKTASRREGPPHPPPPPPRRATVTLDSKSTADLATSLQSPAKPPQPPPPPSRRASIGSAAISSDSTTHRPRCSLDLLSSIQTGSHSLKKVNVSEQHVKKAEEGSSLMGQLSQMIDNRRIYLQDDSDSDSNSDFDD